MIEDLPYETPVILAEKIKFRFWLGIFFVLLTALAWYGCWAASDEYMMLHKLDNPYHEAPWSDASEWAAGPGFLAAFIVFDRTDVPEEAPDSWKFAWFIAPVSGAAWIALVLLTKPIGNLIRRLLGFSERIG